MENMRHLNNGSDILIETTFKDANGAELAVPDYDFEFSYFVSPAITVTASKKGTKFTNCYVDGDKLMVTLDNPAFGNGLLKCRKKYEVPDERFADGKRTEVQLERIAKMRATAEYSFLTESYTITNLVALLSAEAGELIVTEDDCSILMNRTF